MSHKYVGDIAHSKHLKLYHYCHEYSQIENYELAKADNFSGWLVHHKFETHNSDGERRLVDISTKELKALNMYYNRPPNELIFMRTIDHETLHNPIGKKGYKQTKRNVIREWQIANHGHFYRCIETNEIKCEKDWHRAGYLHVRDVANGTRHHCKQLHFEEYK